MKSAPSGYALNKSRWSRRGRRIAIAAMLVLGTVAASAQNAVSTLAGSAGTSGFLNATGTAAQFNFTYPSGAAIGSAGNLYVADAVNNVIRKIVVSTGVVTTLAGSPSGAAGSSNGTGATASFSSPQGVAVDGAGNIYVADTGNHAIRMITPAGLVTTLAGTAGGITPASGNNATTTVDGTTARFSSPLGIAADSAGPGGAAVKLYVADTQNNAIRVVVVATGATSTLAGSLTGAQGSTDATGTAATFWHPDGIAIDSTATNLYVADTFNARVRKVTIASGLVSPVAGSSEGYAEGTGSGAQFNKPTGLAVDASGTVYVSDTFNQVIRSISNAGVTTLYAGVPNVAGSNNGAALSSAHFSVPTGLALSGSTLYVVDTNNKTVRVIAAATAPTIQTHPISISVAASGTATFSVAASSNPSPTYQWQVSSDSGLSFQNLSNGVNGVSGATTNQLTITNTPASMNNYQFQVVVSNGVSTVTSNRATLTVTQAPVITNAVHDFYVTVNQPITGATITATGNPPPTFLAPSSGFPNWATFDTSTGVISGSPADTTNSPYTFTITAHNSGGDSSPVTFTITVQTGPAISAQPVSRSVEAGQSVAFSVTASSSPAITAYQWQRSTDGGSTWNPLSDGGPYSGTATANLTVAPTAITMNSDQFRVAITNAVGTSTSNAATLSVTQTPVFTSASSTTFVVNQSLPFIVKATGFPTPTFGYTGTFPPWASLNTSTGVLTGTPGDTAGSPWIFTLTATSGSVAATQTFTLTVSPTSLTPVITTQPTSQSVGLTQNATFTVVATGNPVPSYQWQRYRVGDTDYVNLGETGQYSGVNTATLTISSVSAEMNGDLYRVLANNTLGTATSNTAQLTITVGTVFSTIAGQPGVKGAVDGVGNAARFNVPSSMVIDASGNAYIADAANHAIRKMTSGGVVTTFAGTLGISGATDGIGAAARFNTPSGIAMDASGNLYVADSGNHAIRMIAPNGTVTTVAGAMGALGNQDGNGSGARFAFPSGITVDANGTLYVADTLNSRIRKINPLGGLYTVSTLITTDSVSGLPVALSLPNSLTVDSSFYLYVADTRNNVIRKISPTGQTTTLAGTPGLPGSLDGTGSAARFNQPAGIALTSTGNLLVADTSNHMIRQVTPTGIVTTVAGQAGVAGSADGGAGTVRFNQPYGVAVDSSGNIYVADTFNHTIRRSGGTTNAQITTDPQPQTVRAGDNATFTVVATGAPTPSYQWQRQAAGTSEFVNLTNNGTYAGVNSATLVISGTTEAMSGDQFQVVVNNLVNGAITSNPASLTVQPPISAPQITTPPDSANVNRGDTVNFTVVASGTAPLTYVWKKDGTVISGASSATLSLPNVQPTDIGLYTVTITNAAGSVTTTPAGLNVNSVPMVATSPRAQAVTAGTSVTFSVSATGGSGLGYQWRKNGVAIPGATSSTLTIPSATTSDAGNYDVIVSNVLGNATSSLAQLTIVTGSAAPTFTAQPASQTVVAGGNVTLNAAAAAYPAPTYQWRKNGVAIAGATSSSLLLSGLQGSDAGDYDVVITNSSGSITSSRASVRVIARSYAGIYFGSFSNGLGSFALYVRPDNTGVFLGYITSSTAPVMSLNVSVDDAGQFSFNQGASTAATAETTTPPRAAALASLSVNGSISGGTVSGSVTGGAAATLSGTRAPDTGATQNVAGLYLAGSSTSAGNVLTIAGANGQAFALAQSGTVTDGGLGTINNSGAVSVSTGRSVITEAVTPATGAISASVTGAVSGAFVGANETAIQLQRLANISTRARVSAGDSIAIAGFVISGTESKPVLIRAVGPTLTSFGVSGVLTTPKLDLYRGQTVIATNTGVGTSANQAALAAAAVQAGAFALKDNADSAILVTLPPGAYTAQVSGGANSGIALVEVYDLSAAAAGQKVVNISTRGSVGSGDNAMIAGVVVTGSTPKRVLIRAVGPGLTPYGVSGVLAQPVLALKTPNGTTIAQNTGWATSTDSAAITSSSASVGAFPLAAADSAMIVTLAPGAYSAQVTGSGSSTGVALVEIYELQ